MMYDHLHAGLSAQFLPSFIFLGLFVFFSLSSFLLLLCEAATFCLLFLIKSLLFLGEPFSGNSVILPRLGGRRGRCGDKEGEKPL